MNDTVRPHDRPLASQPTAVKSVRFLPVLFDEGEIVIKVDKNGAKTLLEYLTCAQQVELSMRISTLVNATLCEATEQIKTPSPAA